MIEPVIIREPKTMLENNYGPVLSVFPYKKKEDLTKYMQTANTFSLTIFTKDNDFKSTILNRSRASVININHMGTDFGWDNHSTGMMMN